MVFKLSTTKIVSRPIDPEEETLSPERVFTAIDTYIETSRKDEFILGSLFDYDGNKIDYIWDTNKQQIASLRSKSLNTELILSSTDFLKRTYIKSQPIIDSAKLSNNIILGVGDLVKPLLAPQTLKPAEIPSRTFKPQESPSTNQVELANSTDGGQDFVYNYEDDPNPPIFDSEFLEDDEEVDDFDEQLAIKSQEFLKEHPELKSEMEIVRLLEGN